MNPFDTPPTGDPLSFEPPAPERSGPGRGRMALVAVLTAGLIGGGIAAVSQFASADEPDLAAAAPDEPTDETIPPVDDEDDDTDEPTEPTEPAGESEGRIVIDHGDGEPIVIDLGDVEGDLERLSECIGLPMFDAGEFEFGEWEPGELPNFEEFFEDLPFDLEALDDLEGEFGEFGGEFGVFDDDGSVTVAGPDGVSVIDLGENGSVTVTKADGEISVETDGDATVTELEEMFGEFEGMLDELFADGEFEGMLDELFDEGEFDEFLESLPNIEEGAVEPVDPEAVQTCLDEVLGN
ncbi:hypothetical protein [Ilumatobacter sp.]|uniref:hypothetical protein n=1 Tax=Ilumatobacter sp. TaxID=1967498 RepID=UPI003AF6037A